MPAAKLATRLAVPGTAQPTNNPDGSPHPHAQPQGSPRSHLLTSSAGGGADASTAAYLPERRTGGGSGGLNAGSIGFSRAIVKCSPLSSGVDDAARSSVELMMSCTDESPSVSSHFSKRSPSHSSATRWYHWMAAAVLDRRACFQRSAYREISHAIALRASSQEAPAVVVLLKT